MIHFKHIKLGGYNGACLTELGDSRIDACIKEQAERTA